MRIRTRIVVPVVAVLAAGGVAAGVALRNPDPVIARVDGSPITQSEARSRVAGITSIHGGDPAKTMGPDWRDKVLKSLVDDVILQREAGRLGVQLTGQELNDAIGRIKAGFKPIGEYYKWLSERKMDEPELMRRIRLQMLSGRIYERVTQDVKITDADITTYYRKHLKEYVGDGGKPSPLDKVKEQVREAVTKEKKDAAFSVWLDALRQKVKLVVLRRDW